jgi:hypothetical protein
VPSGPRILSFGAIGLTLVALLLLGQGVGAQFFISFLVGVIFLGALVAAGLALWYIPRRQTQGWRNQGIGNPKELAELENEARTSIAHALGGLGLVATLALTAYQVSETRRSSEENLRISESGQVTERLSRAIDQLSAVTEKGRPILDARIGGLYLLFRIGIDSEKDSRAIVHIIASYIRNSLGRGDSRNPDSPGSNEPCSKQQETMRHAPRADVSVALQLLSELATKVREEEPDAGWEPGLSEVSFNGMSLGGIEFVGVGLNGTSFANADLSGAIFEGVSLDRASFRSACLRGAQFDQLGMAESVDLRGADLTGAETPKELMGSARVDVTTKR